ncbi:hypothetical protein M513_07272 [Trichuris suis]|uniref:Uncharacterized protein n=1 Tax=Trichuris suis TaxID=68888 RepID=A0A085M3Z7_9BILA|nr:hypothetical protein M513_07272 [Trichuris suis]
MKVSIRVVRVTLAAAKGVILSADFLILSALLRIVRIVVGESVSVSYLSLVYHSFWALLSLYTDLAVQNKLNIQYNFMRQLTAADAR